MATRVQIVKEVSRKFHEKAVMLHKDISVSKDFAVKLTTYVPKGKGGKMLPKIAMTISSKSESLRVVFDNGEDVENYFAEMVSFWYKNQETILNSLQHERQEYIDYLREMTEKDNLKKTKENRLAPIKKLG